MRRKAHNRLWPLLLTLLLVGASAMSVPSFVRAELSQGETPLPPPPNPSGGDPDVPVGSAPAPKPGTGRGLSQPGTSSQFGVARSTQLSVWMLRVRMAIAAAFRVFFRF